MSLGRLSRYASLLSWGNRRETAVNLPIIVVVEIRIEDEITEHLFEGDPYSKIAKTISVKRLYFDLGQGKDYVYHGSIKFKGLHYNDLLRLSEDQQKLYDKKQVSEILPEHYLVKINNFTNIAKDALA